VIAVAQHHIGEITLVPLIEETGIVVLRLTAAPHIKALIHDNEAHGIAHVQQFRGGRVMRTTDGIDTHGLEFGEFAMESILVEGCTQATKVVVLADTIEFDVLAIQPEACLGVELEIAEACGGFYFIDDFAFDDQLGADSVDIWGFRGPRF